MASATIAELELQITSSSSQATQGLNDLIAVLKDLKAVVKGGLGLTTVTNQITALGEAVKKFPKLDKLEQLRDILAQIKGIGKTDLTGDFEKKETQQTTAAAGTDTPVENVKEKTEETADAAENVKEEWEKAKHKVEEANAQVQKMMAGMTKSSLLLEQYKEKWNELVKAINSGASSDKILQLKSQLFSKLQQIRAENARIAKEEQKQVEAAQKEQEAAEKKKQQEEEQKQKENAFKQWQKDVEAVDVKKVLRHTSEIDAVKAKIDKLKRSLAEAFVAKDKGRVAEYASQIKKLQTQLKELKHPAQKGESALSKFAKSLGRIAMYRMVRFILKEIVTALKEGINNLYQFSKEMDGSFAKSMDTISTAILSIRNGIGAALAPFIEALAPAIEKLGDVLMELGNTVGKIGAIMNGKTTYTKAVKSMKEYAEAAKQAQTAAQGFDQLNIAAKDGADYSSMFKEVNLEEESSSALQNFGEILKTIKEIISDLAAFLMPAIRELVALLMPVIQTILGKIVGYIKDILPNVTEILEKVFTIIGALLEKLAPALDTILNDEIGSILNEVLGFINILLEDLMPIISTIFELIQPIADLIGGIIYVLGDIIHSVIETLKPALDNIIHDLGPMITVIVEVLKPVIEFIAGAIQFIGGLISAISDTVGPMTEMINGVFKGVMIFFTEGTDAAAEYWADFGDRMTTMWSNTWNKIKNIFIDIWDRIKDKFMDALYTMGEFGVNFVNKLIDGLNTIGGPLISLLQKLGVEVSNIEHINPQWLQDWKASKEITQNIQTSVVGSGQTEIAAANTRQDIEELRQEIRALKGLDTKNDIELNVYLSGKQLKAEYDRIDNASGVRIGTGGLAY